MQPYACTTGSDSSTRSGEETAARMPSLVGSESEPKPAAADLERLLTQWRLEQGRRNRGLWQMAVLLLIVGACIFVGNAMNWSMAITGAVAFACLMALTPFGVEAVTLSSNGTMGLFTRLQKALREIDDVEAVAPLLDVMDAHSICDPLPAEFPVVQALTRVLSRMDEAAVDRYLRPHSDDLYSCLQWIEAGNHPDLVLASLRLLPMLNDRQALTCAAWFVVRNAPTRNERLVRDAAGAALTSLLASVDLGGPDSLSCWIDALTFGDSTLDWDDLLAPLAVLQAVPQTAPADFLALDYRSRRRLYASLISMNLRRLQTDYTLAVLDMAHRTADMEALSVARQLQMASRRRVREAATRCLFVLKARQEQERGSRTLLRGSGLPPEPVELLLRSVSSGTLDDPQYLLRSSADEQKSSAHLNTRTPPF